MRRLQSILQLVQSNMETITNPVERPVVTLRPREERRLRNGHLWVFSNEVARLDGDAEPGALVAVRAASGAFLGLGIFNPGSLIAVRLTSRDHAALDEEW